MRVSSKFQGPSSDILFNDAGTVNNSVEFDPEFDGGCPAEFHGRGSDYEGVEAAMARFRALVRGELTFLPTQVERDLQIYGDLETAEAAALLGKPVHYAVGANRQDREWENRKGTLGEFINHELSEFKFGPKDGWSITQGSLSGGQRTTRNVMANYVLMVDCDTGDTVDEVHKQIEALGLFAIIWTTHSHLKNTTTIAEAAFAKWARENGVALRAENYAAIARGYMREASKARDWLLDTIGKVCREHVDGGVVYVAHHDPMPRLRILFVLERPFVFAEARATQDEATKAWKAGYAALANSLGVSWDQSCADPARLMYTPRVASSDRERELRLIVGKALDFEAVVALQQAANPFTAAAGGSTKRKSPNTLKTKNLMKFVGKHGNDFEVVQWLESVGADFVGSPGMDKATVRCPNEDAHSTVTANDAGFFAENASARDSGFMLHCSHNSCKTESGGDRAWYLDKLCVAYGVADAMELVDWCPNAEPEEPPVTANDVRAAIDALPKVPTSGDIRPVVTLLSGVVDPLDRRELLATLYLAANCRNAGDRRAIDDALRLADEARVAAARREAATEREGVQARDDVEGAVIRSADTPATQAAIAWQALRAPDTLKQRVFHGPMGNLVRLVRDNSGSQKLVDVSAPSVLGNELRKAVTFVNATADGDERQTWAFGALCNDMLAESERMLPVCRSVTGVPIVAPNGSLVTVPGFHEALGRVYAPADGFIVPPVPVAPTDDDVQSAVSLLLDELLEGFDFDDGEEGDEQRLADFDAANPNASPWERRRVIGDASRMNALRFILLPFVRELIPGSTPLHVLLKPVNRAGATLVADLASIISDGDGMPWGTAQGDDEEMRKLITTKLAMGASELAIDNADMVIGSASFAAALTSGRWSDRLLGSNSPVTGDVRWRWTITARNPKLTNELALRSVFINIVPKVADPDKRADFKHAEPKVWARKNRAELVHACLTIIQNWVAKGRPTDASIRFGEAFTGWAQVMAGILNAAGLPGNASNRDRFTTGSANVERSRTQGFIEAWHALFGLDPVPIGDHHKQNMKLGRDWSGGVLRMMSENEEATLPGVEIDFDHASKQKMRRAVSDGLSAMIDNVFVIDGSGYKFVREYEPHAKSFRYRLGPMPKTKG